MNVSDFTCIERVLGNTRDLAFEIHLKFICMVVGVGVEVV